MDYHGDESTWHPEAVAQSAVAVAHEVVYLLQHISEVAGANPHRAPQRAAAIQDAAAMARHLLEQWLMAAGDLTSPP